MYLLQLRISDSVALPLSKSVSFARLGFWSKDPPAPQSRMPWGVGDRFAVSPAETEDPEQSASRLTRPQFPMLRRRTFDPRAYCSGMESLDDWRHGKVGSAPTANTDLANCARKLIRPDPA
jgi:hypothetical protein